VITTLEAEIHDDPHAVWTPDELETVCQTSGVIRAEVTISSEGCVSYVRLLCGDREVTYGLGTVDRPIYCFNYCREESNERATASIGYEHLCTTIEVAVEDALAADWCARTGHPIPERQTVDRRKTTDALTNLLRDWEAKSFWTRKTRFSGSIKKDGAMVRELTLNDPYLLFCLGEFRAQLDGVARLKSSLCSGWIAGHYTLASERLSQLCWQPLVVARNRLLDHSP